MTSLKEMTTDQSTANSQNVMCSKYFIQCTIYNTTEFNKQCAATNNHIPNSDACTYEALMCSSVCIVLDSEDNGTAVLNHIHVSCVELNVSFVYKYFHTCNKQNVLSRTADNYETCLTCC